MCASQHMKSSAARVSKKIESAIQLAIKCYEKKHDLEWCDGSYDPDEIREAAEMLLSANDAGCICVGYPLGYRTPEQHEDYFSEVDRRTSRIHLRGNAVAFTVELMEPEEAVATTKMCSFRESIEFRKVRLLFSQKQKMEMPLQCLRSVVFSTKGSASRRILLKPTSGTLWGWSFANTTGPARGLSTPPPIRKDPAAKLPDELVNEDSSLHKRAKDWIHMHREFLPKENSHKRLRLR